jgi:hypothetical protein
VNENLSLSATRQAADAAIANFRQAWIALLGAFLVVAPGLVVTGTAGTLAGAPARTVQSTASTNRRVGASFAR